MNIQRQKFYLSSIRCQFTLGQISKLKKSIIQEKKNWFKISCEYAHVHIMSFITTTFQKILWSGFKGVVLTNCLSSFFHFDQIFKFKKGVTPRKKNWIKIFCGYAHLNWTYFIDINQKDWTQVQKLCYSPLPVTNIVYKSWVAIQKY